MREDIGFLKGWCAGVAFTLLVMLLVLASGCAACLPPTERAERDSGKHGIVLECIEQSNETTCTYQRGAGEMHIVQTYRNCR